MSDNSHGSDIVREIRRLLIKNGFNEDQVDLIMEKLRSEITQTGEEQDPELMRVTVLQRFVSFITRIQIGDNASPTIFKAHYDENYFIVGGLLTIAIFETLRELFRLSAILEDSAESPMKMNFDPAFLLRTHFNRILGKECFSSDMIEILRLTRLIIEQEKWTKRYPTLSFYCDWAQTADNRVHRIDPDPHLHALVILEKINDILIDQGSVHPSAAIREISRAFGFAALRQEMLTVFMSKSIPTDIVDSMSNWMGFLGAVLDDFSHRPIRLPDNVETQGKGEAKAAFDRMVNRSKSAGRRGDLVPRVLSVENRTNDSGEPGRPLGRRQVFRLLKAYRLAGFYWHVLLHLHPPVELNGPLVFTETRADFPDRNV